MPLTPPLPSSDDDYTSPSSGFRLNTAVWNAVFTSIGARLRTIEAQRADLQAVIDAGTTQALAVIQTNITPLIETITAEINALTLEAASLSGTLATLLAGGVPASSVPLTAIPGVTATDAQAAVAELHAAIAANTTQIASNTTAIASAATLSTVTALAIALG